MSVLVGGSTFISVLENAIGGKLPISDRVAPVAQ
jgi:hypothetical protein